MAGRAARTYNAGPRFDACSEREVAGGAAAVVITPQ